MNEILKAYGTLGLRPGVSLKQLRQRYRRLSERWHPDVVERATRLQQVSAAYRVLLRYLVVDGAKPHIPGFKAVRAPATAVLPPEEIQRVTVTLEKNGTVDDLLSCLDPPAILLAAWDFLDDFGGGALIIWAGLLAVLAVFNAADAFGLSGAVVLWVALVIYVVFFVLWWRRQQITRERKGPFPTPWR